MPEARMPDVLSQTIGSVETQNSRTVEYLLSIPRGLAWFEGHFPGMPVLPGVVQIDWIMYFIKDLHLAGSFEGVSRMKFTRPIRPGIQLTLRLSAAVDGASVKYRYYDDDGSYSSGNILFRV